MKAKIKYFLSKLALPKIIATRDINVGRDLIGQQNVITSRKHTLGTFKELLKDTDEWKKEWIDDKEVWMYQQDAVFQITVEDDYHDFMESWTQVYPDKFGSHRYSVNLRINNTIVKQLPFVACDGGRISVPLPVKRVIEGEAKYFWHQNSIDFWVGMIVGSFYIYNSLFGIASMSKIEII
jgi:hypothetical protein